MKLTSYLQIRTHISTLLFLKREYNSALIITLWIVGYMTVVINVLLFCFELRAEDDQLNEEYNSRFLINGIYLI